MRRGRNIRYSRVTGGGSPPTPPGPQFYGYRSNIGTGDGLSAGNAKRLSDLWADVALVFDQAPVINLVGTDPATDGHYTGANAMITPPAGLFGVSGKPITIQAINDGGVWVDGQGARVPVNFIGPVARNDYFTLKGINASGGDGTIPSGGHGVVAISANYVTIQRVVAWDADVAQNFHVFSITGTAGFSTTNGIGILLEDCAAFGRGRKMFENFDNNGPNTFRRCWARWENSTCTGPKRNLQDSYHSANLTVDNFISRVYDLEANPYTLTNGDGSPSVYPTDTGCTQGTANAPIAGECQYPGPSVVNDSLIQEGTGWTGENEYLPVDGAHVNCNNILSGFLTLQLSGEPISMYHGVRGMWEHKQFGNTTVQDAFVYVEPGVVDRFRGDTGSFRGFVLAASASDGVHTAAQCYLTRASSIAPNSGSDSITAKWTVTKKITSTTLGGAGISLYPAAETLYTGSLGAKLRYRYQNGSLTSTPLWPWPMGDRIKAATTLASTDGHGHPIEDINATVQTIFGNFP